MAALLPLLTPGAGIPVVAGQAQAAEGVHLVHAGASILTRARLAVIHICERDNTQVTAMPVRQHTGDSSSS